MFAIILGIFVIFAIHSAVNVLRRVDKSLTNQYLAAILEMLLLGYANLTNTSLSLLHCVPIGLHLRLFFDGNVPCYQWWQHALIIFIVVFVVPFIAVILWGSLKLHAQHISAKEFMAACFLSLPYLLYWAFKWTMECWKIVYQPRYEPCCPITKVLYDPFRTPTGNEKETLYWESILTGRRLILLRLHALIADPL